MSITSENLHNHELIGLQCKVIECIDENKIGINGEVLDETKSILRIDDQEVEKHNCVFKFTLPDGNKVVLEGRKIANRPEERIETEY